MISHSVDKQPSLAMIAGLLSIQPCIPRALLSWHDQWCCVSLLHTRRRSVLSQLSEMKHCLKAIESAGVVMNSKQEQLMKPAKLLFKPSEEVCRKLNSVGCTFSRCRDTHACSSCGSDQSSRGQPNELAREAFPSPFQPY